MSTLAEVNIELEKKSWLKSILAEIDYEHRSRPCNKETLANIFFSFFSKHTNQFTAFLKNEKEITTEPR